MMLESVLQRRKFLAATAGGLGLGSLLQALGPLAADEVAVTKGIARLAPDIEPLVQFLEQTPRGEMMEATARRVREGVSYRELLAALLLAGVRNVQPRPSVGFKFHAVLVVNSAHLASLSSTDDDRWLPIFWAIDNFKSSQARDVREGDWTLSAVDESAVPTARQATAQLRDALDSWDEAAADAAITGVVRHHGANHVFEQLAEYAARDFRSIGHKVIYLSNAFRTLQTVGWEYAEPVMRSLVYAMLNHNGEPNPSQSDLAADRPGRVNRERLAEFSDSWQAGRIDDMATRELVQALHVCTPEEASGKVIELVGAGVSLQSIWDGLFASAGELLMRQRGIVALHSVTTTNAIHHAFRAAGNEATRKFLLLQCASFLPMFRNAARDRGKLANRHIEDLVAESNGGAENAVASIFETMSRSRTDACRMTYDYLAGGGQPQLLVDHARRLVFLKGNDSHDYKFSSAAMEDYRVLTPDWRNRFLAASTFQLRSAGEKTRSLTQRIQSALQA